MIEIGKNSKLQRILSILILFQFSLSISPAAADTFCDKALKKSDSYLAPIYSQIKFHISDQAATQAEGYGISAEELKWLIRQSKISSYPKNGEHLLPIFRTIRTDEIYRDYIFMVKLRKPYRVAEKSQIQVLSIDKISEKGQKHILSELARRLHTKPLKLKVRIRGLERYGFERGPVTVEIAPPILLKLQLKHKINFTLIKMALEQTPDKIEKSDRADDRVEMFYYGDKIMLTIVLGRLEENNTTSLVTSYFTQRID